MSNPRISATLAALKKKEGAVFAPFLKHEKAAKAKRTKWSCDYMRNRRKSDPAFKLLQGLRGRLYKALRATGAVKSTVTTRMLGCSIAELMDYLATFFAPGMSWENHG